MGHSIRWVRDSVMTGSGLKQFATIVSVVLFLWRVALDKTWCVGRVGSGEGRALDCRLSLCETTSYRRAKGDRLSVLMGGGLKHWFRLSVFWALRQM